MTVDWAARAKLGRIAAGLSGVLLGVAALGAWVPFALALERTHPGSSAEVLPEGLTVEDLQGRTRHLDEILPRSNRLLVFWRVDSKPSREALIHLHQNRDRLSERNVFVVGISPSESSETAAFLHTQGIGFDTLHDPGGGVATALGLGYVYPSLALVDENGNVLGRTEGGGESFDAQFSRLLRACTAGEEGGGWIWILGSVLVGAALLGLVLGR